jgi:peptide/nickel transport system permease protein
MTEYIIRRLLMALLVIILVSLSIFLLMHLLPGDPLYIYLGDVDIANLTPEQIQGYRHELGLDRSLPVQYFSWMGGILHGDFGESIIQGQPVLKLMKETYPTTLYLGLYAFLLSAIVGIAVGLIAGLKRGKWIDQITTVLVYVGVATPQFWLGILLIYFFGLKLGLLPMSGYTLPTTNFVMSLKQTIMPVICLSIAGLAATARQMRTALIEVIRQDYIRTAWAKGLKESDIVRRHALKNSLIPVMTVIGLNVRTIFGGSVVIETVFSIPGVGRLLVGSVLGHDFQVVQSLSLVLTVVVVLTNLIVDLSYGLVDPRIRYS